MPVIEVGGERQPFQGFTDLPLYGRGPGWLKTCQNFRVMPGGYLEARGGFDAIKPSGGTAADPIAAGIFIGAHEHTMADGFIWTTTTGGTVYSANLAQRGYFDIWPTTTAADDAIYIGSNIGQFSRVVFYVGQGTYGATDPVLAYEYPKASDWSSTGTLTLTSTPDFQVTGEQLLEFAIPSDWVLSVRNGVYGYFVRARIATLNDGVATKVTQTTQRVYCDWQGARQIYVASAASAAATDNGTLKWYGQSSASVAAWNSVSTSLFSGNYPRARFASYRNILYMVNGKEQKRWDNNTLADMGFTAPTSSGATADVSVLGNLTGLFYYSITYGYGPAGEWGESTSLAIGNTGAIAAKKATWTLNLTSIPAQAETIYCYRTTDTTSVPSSGAFPQFRIQTLTRDATGSFPTTFTDNTVAFPYPPVELNIVDRTPPARCKFIVVHKNRCFLANNNQYPGRQWWSDPFEAEAFDKDENYADFTRSTGGQITGMIEAFDQVISFTEDRMFYTANVDQDQPSIGEIPGGVGCIAPDSVRYDFGYLCWLSRNGVYVWDGQNPPERVSDNTSGTFGKMSFETHGGSRGLLHNRMYETHLMNNGADELATPRFRYDLVTRTWSKLALGVSKTWSPLISVTAPVGHADAGVRHPLYGQSDKDGTDYAIYLGEWTTQDAGNNYTCTATAHFGVPALNELTVDRAFCFYSKDSGWATPTLDNPAPTVAIGSATGAFTSMTPDGGTDYTRLVSIPAEGTLGTNDLDMSFSAVSAAGGTVNAQRLLSIGLDGSGFPAQWAGSN